jgi:flagellar basal-body rod modification protein FlgD
MTTITNAMNQAANAGLNKSIDYNQYLNLFMTELKNQDPTNPMDTSQTLTQLATFSSVEQQINANDVLKSILTSINNVQSLNLINKSISSLDGTMSGVVNSIINNTDGSQSAQLQNGSILNLNQGYNIINGN